MIYSTRNYWARLRPEYLKIGLSISIGLSILVINHTSYSIPEELQIYDLPPEPDFILTPPPTVQLEKKLPPPPTPEIQLTDIVEKEEPEFTEEIPIEETSEVSESTTEETIDPSSFAEPAPEVEIIATEEKEPLIENEVLLMADRMPVYEGCDTNLDERERRQCTSEKILKSLYSHIKYPSIARENRIEGTVVISFVIDKTGNITNVKTLRGLEGGCTKEAIKAIKKLKRFLPAKHNGRPVSVEYKIPIKFRLN